MGSLCSSGTGDPQSNSNQNAAVASHVNSSKPKQKKVKKKHTARTQELLERIKHIPMIQMLNDAQKVQVAESLKEKDFMPGEIIMKEGALGQDFFLITHGICEVFVGKNKVSELRDTDYCGVYTLCTLSTFLIQTSNSLSVSDRRTGAAECECKAHGDREGQGGDKVFGDGPRGLSKGRASNQYQFQCAAHAPGAERGGPRRG